MHTVVRSNVIRIAHGGLPDQIAPLPPSQKRSPSLSIDIMTELLPTLGISCRLPPFYSTMDPFLGEPESSWMTDLLSLSTGMYSTLAPAARQPDILTLHAESYTTLPSEPIMSCLPSYGTDIASLFLDEVEEIDNMSPWQQYWGITPDIDEFPPISDVEKDSNDQEPFADLDALLSANALDSLATPPTAPQDACHARMEPALSPSEIVPVSSHRVQSNIEEKATSPEEQTPLLGLGLAVQTNSSRGQFVRWAPAHSIIRQHPPPPSESQLSRASQLPMSMDSMAARKTTPTCLLPALTGEGREEDHGEANGNTMSDAVDALRQNSMDKSSENRDSLANPSLMNDKNDSKVRLARKHRRVDGEGPMPRKYRRHCARASLAHVTYKEGTREAHTYTWERRSRHWKVTPAEWLEMDLLSHLYLHGEGLSVYVRPEAGDMVCMELHQGREFSGLDKLGSRSYRVSIEEMEKLFYHPDQYVELTYQLCRTTRQADR
ncbi:hypothetical protein F4821DRAFT_252329 [Hypoxylon rubiginosum]|uniref:Uncharacterized protein n=1 Tax=Hypoxylon rubiginosum TaxID=110542 RepID=A0ACC0CID2_9PEZI|nr:hypothetical protein F4821DRAFT_252329 [Hypoxylon rubiginosum]